MLRSAREARGLDHERVERDTRIRARYLAALERGAWDELPGEVYAKGFVRSYARYLGLAPDTMVALYRLETGAARPRGLRGATRRVEATPRARPAPRALVVSPRLLTVGLLTLLVAALAAYLSYQVITFARTPELTILEPAGDVLAHREAWITIKGATAPNARVSVSGLPVNPVVEADAEGRFSVRIDLLPGPNLVTLSAFDPRTSRHSAEVTRRIEVVSEPDRGESPGESPVPSGSDAGDPDSV